MIKNPIEIAVALQTLLFIVVCAGRLRRATPASERHPLESWWLLVLSGIPLVCMGFVQLRPLYCDWAYPPSGPAGSNAILANLFCKSAWKVLYWIGIAAMAIIFPFITFHLRRWHPMDITMRVYYAMAFVLYGSFFFWYACMAVSTYFLVE